ncbi:DUF1345 domain-containing protein [Roseomonas gilardii]|uniref:DUF1345 domain-containing protein n=1 Tax=Roseomonas gilardii TaxID=257708 RepID=UPI0004B95A95|nr:DUF1345 domain-containing protein [Roseomonas gilardii]SUE43776.1 Predicted membrane protein [Roseomonas gilardii subsp. rosea]
MLIPSLRFATRSFSLRPGLSIGLLVGLCCWGALARFTPLRHSAALLLGWDAAMLVYLLMLLHGALTADPRLAKKRAEALDETRWGVLGGTVAAVLVSLIGVALDMAGARGDSPWTSALAMATVLLSWVFVQVLFATHYMHEATLRGGIEFPGGEKQPDLLEFLYFSFTVGMTAQVSDVTTSSPGMRRLVLLHGILSFIFNAAVIAGTVNIAAGLAG